MTEVGGRREREGLEAAAASAPPGGPPAELAGLAALHGVATRYRDWSGRVRDCSAVGVRAALAALGADVDDPVAGLAMERGRRAGRPLDPTLVADGRPLRIRVPDGVPVRGEVLLEDGGCRDGVRAGPPDAPSEGIGEPGLPLHLPAGLPPGRHRLVVRAGRTECLVWLLVPPERLPPPRRGWGWAVQLYSVRSSRSWGIGDLADLRRFAAWAGATGGADVVLVNPLHASGPRSPLEPSPYAPASRRFVSPLYLAVEELPEYAAADEGVRRRVDRLREGLDDRSPLIDRDAVWAAKRAALELLHRAGPAQRPAAERSQALTDFATWCALADLYGDDWRTWPEALRDPRSPAVAAWRNAHGDAVAFHGWLQHCCAGQLAAAQGAARDAGMAVGVMNDLAVGVDPGGADAWALRRELAQGVTVGAPPDSFNQRGQDWGLPPWRPDRLAETGYEPVRDMVRAALAHGGGLRVDHVLGLFRSWWVPHGRPPSDGAYVAYDAGALLAVVCMEAARAGAVVVGEDLGTVPPEVPPALERAGLLGCEVLWFARDGAGGPLPPARWPERALASISTHDLPTAGGFLAGEHVRVRAALGQLGRPVAEERADADRERAELLALLRAEGLLPVGTASAEGEVPEVPDRAAIVAAMHRLLAATRSRLAVAALTDAVGDLRQPNLPGTVDEYPNWRLPVSDASGRPLTLEEIVRHPGVRDAAAALSARSGGGAAAAPPDPPGRPPDGPVAVRSDATATGRAPRPSDGSSTR